MVPNHIKASSSLTFSIKKMKLWNCKDCPRNIFNPLYLKFRIYKLKGFFIKKKTIFCLSFNFLNIMLEIRLRFSQYFSELLSLFYLTLKITLTRNPSCCNNRDDWLPLCFTLKISIFSKACT